MAAVLIAIATLPAQIFAGRLQRAGLEAAAFTGSIWSGQAQSLAWRGTPLGDLRWSFAPLDLLRGRLGARLQLTRSDGQLATHASVSPGGTLHLTDTSADLPMAVVTALPVGLPRNWQGRVSGQFAEIVVSQGWPTALRGTLELDGLVSPPPRNLAIGSYHVEVPDPGVAERAAGTIDGRIKDKSGPFAFDGRLMLAADRSFLLEGLVAPRGTPPPPVAHALDLLGPADASGRREISLSGTL